MGGFFRTFSSGGGAISSRYPGACPPLRRTFSFPLLVAQWFCAATRPEKVAGPLHDVISSATDYLVQRAPNSKVLGELRSVISAIRQPDRERRLALLAGIGPSFEDRLEGWHRVRKIFPVVPTDVAASLFGSNGNALVLTGTCQAALMFGSFSPTISAPDAMVIADWLVRLYSPDSSQSDLVQHVHPEPLEESNLPAWDQGYQLAEEFLEGLELLQDGANWIDIEEVYSKLGIGQDRISLEDTNIRAVSIASGDHKPYALLNVNHPTHQISSGRRFTLAHELCHLLYDRSYGQQLAIASGPWAPRDLERRANAFAAMLLMPTSLILPRGSFFSPCRSAVLRLSGMSLLS